jgi:hypothetical protein
MAHDSKYGKVSGECCYETVAAKTNISGTDEATSLMLSENEASKAKMTNQGKHKGSLLYTKYDKSK